VFTTTGEKLTATSILLQGTTVAASGVVYGQGVRCLGGTLKRLFVKTAFDGSILAPDFDDNDPSVSSTLGGVRQSDQPGREPLVPRLLPRSARPRRVPVGEHVQRDTDGAYRLGALIWMDLSTPS
jgi:hypothetical protein